MGDKSTDIVVVILFFSQIDRLCATVCVQDPSKTPNAVDLDSMTLHSYIEQHGWTAGQCYCCYEYMNPHVLT